MTHPRSKSNSDLDNAYNYSPKDFFSLVKKKITIETPEAISNYIRAYLVNCLSEDSLELFPANAIQSLEFITENFSQYKFAMLTTHQVFLEALAKSNHPNHKQLLTDMLARLVKPMLTPDLSLAPKSTFLSSSKAPISPAYTGVDSTDSDLERAFNLISNDEFEKAFLYLSSKMFFANQDEQAKIQKFYIENVDDRLNYHRLYGDLSDLGLRQLQDIKIVHQLMFPVITMLRINPERAHQEFEALLKKESCKYFGIEMRRYFITAALWLDDRDQRGVLRQLSSSISTFATSSTSDLTRLSSFAPPRLEVPTTTSKTHDESKPFKLGSRF